MIYPWQEKDWKCLSRLTDHWPHAMLLHGQSGIGKLVFARHLAQSLLCEAQDPFIKPCKECIACNWFQKGNHPDYRSIIPDGLELIYERSICKKPIDNQDGKQKTYDNQNKLDNEKRKNKANKAEIRVEQIRMLLDFCALSSHRGGSRIVLLYPADRMNTIAANTLLKTLEEPSKNTFFLLVCVHLEKVLPTIVSRCFRWAMRVPDYKIAEAWLSKQGVAQPAQSLAISGGSPLFAISEEYILKMPNFVLQLSKGEKCDPLLCGEMFLKKNPSEVYDYLQRWLYDLLSIRKTGFVRYFPEQEGTLAELSKKFDLLALISLLSRVTRQRRYDTHPLNTRLLCESLCLEYRDLFFPE